MLAINPKWLLEQAGITIDEETADLLAIFTMRLQNAHDKKKFLKDCLRRAMQDGDGPGPLKRLRGRTVR
jgi:hypothetical protein